MQVDLTFKVVGITKDHSMLVTVDGFKLGVPGQLFNKEAIEKMIGQELPYVEDK